MNYHKKKINHYIFLILILSTLFLIMILYWNYVTYIKIYCGFNISPTELNELEEYYNIDEYENDTLNFYCLYRQADTYGICYNVDLNDLENDIKIIFKDNFNLSIKNEDEIIEKIKNIDNIGENHRNIFGFNCKAILIYLDDYGIKNSNIEAFYIYKNEGEYYLEIIFDSVNNIELFNRLC